MYREKTISKKEDLNDRYLCSSICICESAKRAAKHIILPSSTRFITKTLWIETLMNTLKTTRKWKKQLLNTHLAYFPASRGLSRRGKNFGFVVRDLCLHPEIYSKSKWCHRTGANTPDNKQNQSTAHASDLSSDKFWLFPAIVENSVLARIRLVSNQRRY